MEFLALTTAACGQAYFVVYKKTNFIAYISLAIFSSPVQNCRERVCHKKLF